MAFPTKEYDRLRSLQERWGVSQDDIFYAIENGLLSVSIWLPLRWVERGVMKHRKFVFEQHEHLEGFVGLRPVDCRRISSTGSAKLRIFRSICPDGHILRMAYEPPQPAISVRMNDLVILQKDRDKFETTYHLTTATKPAAISLLPENITFHTSNDYRHIVMNGESFHLGEVQARIIQQLHDAAQSRNPWVHGKTLIYESGSNAVRLRDLFKNKSHWRKIMVSNERGYYRLNIPLQEFENEPANVGIYGQKHKQDHEKPTHRSG